MSKIRDMSPCVPSVPCVSCVPCVPLCQLCPLCKLLPLTFWCIALHLQWLLLRCVASNSKKRYNILVLKATWFSHVGKILGNQCFFLFPVQLKMADIPKPSGIIKDKSRELGTFLFSQHVPDFCDGCWPFPTIMKTYFCTVGDWWAIISAQSQSSNCLNLVSPHKSKWHWESWIVWNFTYVNQDKLKMTAFVVNVKAISFAFMKLESWQVTKKPFKGD